MRSTSRQPVPRFEPHSEWQSTALSVVRAEGKTPGETPFITLDEGIRSGDIEVAEAGRVQGLVRPRTAPLVAQRSYGPAPDPYRGDKVNTLVLVNHSSRPLLLLAGEIVTGGKQDRIVAKDRIVPADADPSILESSASSRADGLKIRQPSAPQASQSQELHGAARVRERAMVDQDQQQVGTQSTARSRKWKLRQLR